MACPHCGVCGTLNRHSFLNLYDPDSAPDNQRVRSGQRVYCSNRGTRNGCGRTATLRLAQVLPRHILRLDRAWIVLSLWLSGLSLRQAHRQSATRLSLRALYSFRQRLRRHQESIRTRLTSHQPPPHSLPTTDPLVQTLAHLQSAFRLSALSQFQRHFQVPLFS